MELEMRLKGVSLLESERCALREEQKNLWSGADIVVAHLARWREEAIAGELQHKMQEIEGAKAEYLELRKERRQVENVLSARRVVEKAERSRREQQTVDNWFAQTARRKKL